MSKMNAVFLFLPLFLLSSFLFAQDNKAATVPARDVQAVDLLANAIAAAGGISALAPLQSFTGSGTITYYWAGKEVEGAATIRGRGLEQFRLDANLPSGTRSWTVSHGRGSLREADGSINTIPYHNAITLGSLTFPYSRIVAALQDSSFSATYVGLQEIAGSQFHQIRLSKQVVSGSAATEASKKLGTVDVFIDPNSFAVLGIQDLTHPRQTILKDIHHAIYFADFRVINGVSVPFAIDETIDGQKTWSLHLNDVRFNAALTDADFSTF